MKTLVTGLQPSGQVTIGNYIGVIKNIKKLQNDHKIFLFIANMHSITIPQEKLSLKKSTNDLAKLLISCGIKSENVSMFIQSEVMEHTQLGYILMCNTSMDELRKMTQFKDKSDKGVKMPNGTSMIPTGLLTYPALMAADILLYQAEVVPIGEDQTQHLELTKQIADRMNNKFGEMFTIPKTIISNECSRIMSLVEPTKKMSKSDANSKSYITLLDEPSVARKKIISAMTDSENIVKYDKQNKPGVSNLIEIYSALKDIKISEAEMELSKYDYKEFKTAVADQVCLLLEEIQSQYNSITDEEVNLSLELGKKEAQKIAYKTLMKVQNKMGINNVKK